MPKYYLLGLKSFIISLFLIFNFAYGQVTNSSLSGIVLDAATGELLPGANIMLRPGERGTSSDMQGRFHLNRLSPGSYEIFVSYIGYAVKTDTVRLTPGVNPNLHIRLLQQPIDLQEIMASADRDRLFQDVNLSRDVLTNQHIRITTSLVEPDLIRSLAHLPGVVMANDYNSRFYVRGGRGNENQVLVDGVTLHNPYHAFGFFSIFNSDAIKNVEVYRGIFPAKYSERLSSVTNVILRDGNARQFCGQGMVSLVTSKLLLEGPIMKLPETSGRKWTFMVSGRRTYLDKIVKEVPFYFYDVSAKSVYDSGEKNRLILHGFLGVDRIKPNLKEHYAGQVWMNRAAGFQWYRFVSPGSTLNMSLSYSDFHTTAGELEISDNIADDPLQQLNRIRESMFSSEWSRQMNNSLRATFGYGFSHFNIDEYIESLYQQIFQQNWRNHVHHKAYFTLENNWQNLGIMEFGLTGLYFTPVKRVQWSPRLGVKWLINEHWRLKAGFGRHYQALTTINDEDDTLVLFDAWIPSPADRPVPHADHLGLGMEFNNNSSIETNVELYYRRYGGLTRFNRSQLAGEPFYLDGRAESYGLEFRIDYQLKKFYGFANYALGKATSTFFLRNQPMQRFNDFKWQSFPSAGDIRHILDVTCGIRTSGHWDFSIAIIFQSGRPYTAPLGSIYNYYAPPNRTNRPMNLPLLSEPVFYLPTYRTYELVYSAKNAYRFPFYQRVDVSAAREFIWFGKKCSLFIHIYNLLFRRNAAFYLASSNEIVQSMPFLPSLGVSFRF
ncbi:TonB-dependent receptor [candidate division KSB1 bacterium]|nr:TonB-dependent receptor [candidate division KSB1 bacterium]